MFRHVDEVLLLDASV